jgi:ATP-dependent Clp protease ATP-binding subunit ClpA
MVGRFAAEAGRAVEAGVREAKAAGARAVGTEHMLLGLYAVPGEACRILVEAGIEREDVVEALDDHEASALAALGISLEAVRDAVGLDDLPPPAGRRRLPFREDAKTALNLALAAARRHRHRTLGSEHVLLGLLDEGGRAARLLAAAGADADELSEAAARAGSARRARRRRASLRGGART